jgi:hypothetical protein
MLAVALVAFTVRLVSNCVSNSLVSRSSCFFPCLESVVVNLTLHLSITVNR